MSISLIDNFIINVKKPIDSRITANNSTEREAIPVGYRYDGMQVFQIDNRQIYVWNQTLDSGNGDWEDGSGNTILTGLGITNSIAFWNTDSTIGNSIMNIKINDVFNNKGYMGINTNDPKSEITISPSNSTGTSLNISNKDISFNLAYDVVQTAAKASIKIGFDETAGILEFTNRIGGSNPIDPLSKRLTLGTDRVETYGILSHHQTSLLSGVTGSYLISSIRETPGGSGGNLISASEYIVRESTGNDWLSLKIHDGVSIDGVHATPNAPDAGLSSGGTLTFIERHPYLRKHYFGSANRSVLTIDSGELTRYVGINTKTPSTTLDIRGEYPSGNGPFITLKNDIQGVSASTFGVGIMTDVNKTSVNKYFIGQRQDNNKFVISNGSSPFNDFLRIDQSGNTEIVNLVGITNSNLAIVSDGGVIKTRNYVETLSSSEFLATDIKHGLLNKDHFKRLDSVKNIGWFSGLNINGSSGALSVSGDVSVAFATVLGVNSLGHGSSKVLVTIANAMANTNYLVKMYIQSLTANIATDLRVCYPVFKPLSVTQFEVGLGETQGLVDNLKVHIEVVQLY